MDVHPFDNVIPVSGWLLKRHEHKSRFGKRWGKRFVILNSKRGTLSISKGASAACAVYFMRNICRSCRVQSRVRFFRPSDTVLCAFRSVAKTGGASTILPLRDVCGIRRMVCSAKDEVRVHSFEIVCPPFRLQFCAANGADCDRWVSVISENVDDWHSPERLLQKALSSGTPAAVASDVIIRVA